MRVIESLYKQIKLMPQEINVMDMQLNADKTVDSKQSDFPRKFSKRSKALKHIIGETPKCHEDIIVMLNAGTKLHRFKSSKKCFTRNYFIEVDNSRLNYSPTNKRLFCKELPYVNISDLTEVRKGWNTDVFNHIESRIRKNKSIKKLNAIKEEQCFSVINEKTLQTIDLVAPNQEVRDLWVKGLSFLIAVHKKHEKENEYANWLKKKFREADRNNNGNLNFQETLALLNHLNISMSKRHAKALFHNANIRKNISKGEESLDEEEFYRFYQLIMNRLEIRQLFKKYSKNAEIMGPEELMLFLRHEEKMTDVTLEDCEMYIKTYEPEETQVTGYLSSIGLQNLLLSPEFSIFDRKHQFVCQDMSHPLTHYYIASSHNTYLLRDQLFGESSIEAYRLALLRGCRCVELDVWDGDTEPVIYHGYTLTSKIAFRDVIDTIRDFGFKVSKFPIILSIENHCGEQQQKQMANYLISILGDKLHKSKISPQEDSWPSPQSLSEKILVKCQKRTPSESTGELNFNNADKSDTLNSNKEMIAKDTSIQLESSLQRVSDHSSIMKADNSLKSAKKNIKVRIAEELSDIVNYCAARKFISFNDCFEKWKFYEMASIAEKKSEELAGIETNNYVKYNERHLCRIYPKGTRTDSSNYKPIPHWNMGCHLVALNYQTWDTPVILNEALFSLNGKCGYVLKPEFLRQYRDEHSVDSLSHPKRVTITVISGQHIPKKGQSIEGEIIDPYVKIKVYGHQNDKFKFNTKYVKNNGFNPIWNEKCNFLIRSPELAFIFFVVKDHETTGKDERLGQYMIPFQAVMQGYRHIHLLDQQNQPIVNSSLFVHISITDS